ANGQAFAVAFAEPDRLRAAPQWIAVDVAGDAECLARKFIGSAKERMKKGNSIGMGQPSWRRSVWARMHRLLLTPGFSPVPQFDTSNEPFQRLLVKRDKLLKQFSRRDRSLHRAKAPVLMRVPRKYEISKVVAGVSLSAALLCAAGEQLLPYKQDFEKVEIGTM